MTEQQRTPADPAQDGADSEGRHPGSSDDLGGPASALGTGVEEALTGTEAREDDEGGAASSPQPNS
jgi:hypothetical protein